VESVCEIGNLRGDATLRRCGGVVTLGNLGGDLAASDLRGGIAAGMVGGDIQLETPLVKGASYIMRAAGDISLRVRGEIHARFVAQTDRGTIQTRLPLTIERGRRRHLVGAIGRAEAIVTLQSHGGDISISAADPTQERPMNDEFVTDDGERRESAGAGSGGFGFQWNKSPGGFRFAAGFGPDDPDGPGDPRMRGGKGSGSPFTWDDAQRAEYERRIREMSERTAKAARRAAERASEYAERAARRARETDWEAVGRDVRSSIEHAMSEMEHLLEQFRSNVGQPQPPNPPTPPNPPAAPPPPVSARNKDEVDAQRRSILEQLRSGAISLEEAERQLNTL
jgi:hypothetical protein